jgi:hypothetical protein
MTAIRAANKFLAFTFFPFLGLKMRENSGSYSILREGSARRKCEKEVREGSARRKCEKEVREGSARRKCEKEVREARRIKILYPANLVFMLRFPVVTSPKVEQRKSAAYQRL